MGKKSVMHRFLLVIVFLGLGLPALADRNACEDAARLASERSGVPLDILRAITVTETMHNGSAWPWTVHSSGKGHWFGSRAEAEAFASELESRGAMADLGCFQINSRWHAAHFHSFDAMLDPIENALYAAEYLAGLRAAKGDWRAAIAAYHSAQPDRGAAYLDRVMRALTALGGTGSADAPQALERIPTMRRNKFPLFLAGDPVGLGSVMPRQPGISPLVGGP